MGKIDFALTDLRKAFPKNFTEAQIAKGQTLFLKELAYDAHKFYGGKMMTVPKAGVYGFNWFNVWYTPGVSKISTTIRDNNDASFELSNRGNLVAVVSDSTRVLGDGDVTPSGGLGVMEGKAFLMKYLGGVDGVALCINSYNKKGEHDPDKIIDFVKMVEPSFGAVNLEDISQPNCYKVLDTLREECEIPGLARRRPGDRLRDPGGAHQRPQGGGQGARRMSASSCSAPGPRTRRSSA